MKPFKFLNTKLYTRGDISLPTEIIDCCFDLCKKYNEYIQYCREDYLRLNPFINPNSDYAYPIPHNNIEQEFPEGLLWHGGSEYYEEDDRVVHFCYLDVPGDGEEDDYFFEINEDGFGGFYINDIGRERSRWD
jgi:hypothetical protein